MDDMPRYQCHKIVRALKIDSYEPSVIDGMVLKFGGFITDIRIPQNQVNPFLKMNKSDPGYMVVYEDGYRSWSPSVAFELGYTLL